jgi:acyl dehydratase
MNMTTSYSALLLDPANTTLYWDDLEQGTRFTSSARTITESDVVGFAALSADYNRMHVDAEFAAQSSFGQRIAHGMLVASISIGLLTRTVQNQLMEKALVGLLENKLSWPKATFFNDTIHVVAEVAERRETRRADRGIIVFRRQTFNQRGEVVCDSSTTMLMLRRPQESAA